MTKKPLCFFTIADEANMKYAEKLATSLKRFHPDVPIELVGGEILKDALKKDSMFFYRATPVVASQLIKEYEVVVKIDADSIVTAPLDEAWSGEFDIKCVLNSNPREFKKYPYTIWDLNAVHEYVNCGFVSMKSEAFIDHWHKLCFTPRFDRYQMREQDLLNIMVHYGSYKAQLLDNGDGFWGLASKGFWPEIELRDDKLVLPANQEWNKIDKIIRVIHWAGGNEPNKMNFNTKFKPEVSKWLTKLTSAEI